MITDLSIFKNIFLSTQYVDMRMSIDGLAGYVQNIFERSPLDPNLFIFLNSRRNRMKILYWDQTGFAIWYKRLEKGVFPFPLNAKEKELLLSSEQLHWLLRGIDVWKIKPHQQLFFEKM